MKQIINLFTIIYASGIFILSIPLAFSQAQTLQGQVQQNVIPLRIQRSEQQFPQYSTAIQEPFNKNNYYNPNILPQPPISDRNLSTNIRDDNFNLSADHGAETHGVVGAQVEDNTGRILVVYPYSHLHNFNIRAGDYIVAINGQPYTFSLFLSTRQGMVGETINWTIFHRGHYLTVDIPRIDARLIRNYDNYFESQARKTREW